MCKGTFGLVLEEMSVQKDFWVKMGFWGMGMQRDFWAKIGVWGNGCAKRLLGKIGVLEEMGMQRNI